MRSPKPDTDWVVGRAVVVSANVEKGGAVEMLVVEETEVLLDVALDWVVVALLVTVVRVLVLVLVLVRVCVEVSVGAEEVVVLYTTIYETL